MATTNKALAAGVQVPATATVIYTAPPNTTTIIKKVTVTNTTAAAVAITLYVVTAAGTPSAANTVTSAKPVAAGQVYEAYEVENHVLNAGDMLQALAGTAAALSLKAAGIEIV